MLWTLGLGLWLAAASPTDTWQLAQSTYELDQQTGRDFVAADKDLNIAFQHLLPKLTPLARKKLQAAQLAWIPYRDAWAEYASAKYLGGTLHSMLYTRTRAELTRQRAAQLKAVADDLVIMNQEGLSGFRPDIAAECKRSDADLNLIYKEIAKALNPDTKQLLLAGELAWIKYRDGDVAFWGAWRTDQPAVLVRSQRQFELTESQCDALGESAKP